MLKTYIKTNMANNFIWPLKLLIGVFIFFGQKSNNSFYLYVDYWNLNNSSIKKQYLLPFIGKSLDQLD